MGIRIIFFFCVTGPLNNFNIEDLRLDHCGEKIFQLDRLRYQVSIGERQRFRRAVIERHNIGRRRDYLSMLKLSC